MKWNYRLIEHHMEDGLRYEVHETFYDEDEAPVSYNKLPVNLETRGFNEMWFLLQDISGCLNHYAAPKQKIYGELSELDLEEAPWGVVAEHLKSDEPLSLTGGRRFKEEQRTK